jgi:hypothetical protein
MIYAQGMLEYGAILAAIAGNTLTGLFSNFDPSWNVILIVGGIIFFFWLVVFKL